MAVKPENGRLIKYFAPILTIGVLGVVMSVSAWQLAVRSENRAIELEFAGRADNQPIILENGIGGYWEKLSAVRALFDSSDKIGRAEFEKFSNLLLKGHPAILNIAWIPRVKRDERVAHELAAASDGFSDYHIRAVAPDSSLPVAPEKDEYFPKYYSTEARGSRVYGLDLNDGGPRMRTVARIRDGNLLSTSPPLTLHIGEGDRLGFWAGVPVYARGMPHATQEDRRRNLLGIVQGVFQIGVMIDTIFSDVRTPVRLYLFAPGATRNDPPVYFKSRLGTGSIEARSQAELAEGLSRSFPINFGDVQWTLVASPESTGSIFIGHSGSWIILISGLLLTAGVTSFIWATRRSGRKLEAANGRIEQQHVRFDAALNNMAQGLLMFDPAGRLVISNRQFPELFGVPWQKWEKAALGKTPPQLMQFIYAETGVALKNQTQIITDLKSILDSRQSGTIVFERTDGRTFSASCTPMVDNGFVVTFEDITDRRHTEDQVLHMAHHDALTDLANRKLFYEKMGEVLSRAPPNGNFAVFSLDLDRFKNVNDTLGHPIGDKLLQAVADRLRSCVRDTDIVARLGGDEFAIVQEPSSQPTDAVLLAMRLIEAVNSPYSIDGHQVIVGTSIGIAIAPSDGSDPDQLMKKADLALYTAKASGGSGYRFYKAEMEARRQQRLALEMAS